MSSIQCDDLVEALNSIPEKYFNFETVTECLKTHPVGESSLQPYLHFRLSRPARNLIFKNDLFELNACCWNAGQETPVHAFPERKCWIVLLSGRLRLQLFETAPNAAKLTDAFEIRRDLPVIISPIEPAHQVLNLPSFKQRAVSLHLYSPPLRQQLVFGQDLHPSTQHVSYDSRYGNRDDL